MDGRDAVIAQQGRRIAELSAELEAVSGERDMLLLELDQLRCQLELRDLTAARSVTRSTRHKRPPPRLGTLCMLRRFYRGWGVGRSASLVVRQRESRRGRMMKSWRQWRPAPP